MKTGKIKRRVLAVLTSMLILLSAGTASAAGDESDLMPALEGSAGTAKIICQYDDNGAVTKIDGVQLEMIKVADVSVNNGCVTYTLLPEYQGTGIDFDDMTADESNKAAADLYSVKESKGYTGTQVTTDNDGKAVFTDLPYGMYLVSQTGKEGTATGYENVEPFLVMVPGADPASHEWIYDVTAEPKLEIVKTTPPETEPPKETTSNEPPSGGKTGNGPKTGDEASLPEWAGMILMSSVVIFLVLRGRKKKENS